MLVVVLAGAVSVPLVFHAVRKRGGPRPLADDASLRRAVARLADSYLPSIPEKAEAARKAGHDNLVAYYLSSGGQSEELQRLVLKAVDAQLSPRNRFELVLLLRLLSSRWGSLLLTRTACMTRKWPFVHAFTNLPLRRRQDILRRWSLHWLPQMRKAFKGTKALILAVALANGPDNLLWRGMGFPGTDPARPEVPLASSLQEEAGVAAAVVDVVEERAKNSFCKPLDLLAGRGLRMRAAGDADRKLAGEADLDGVLECDAVVVGSGGGGGTAGGVLAAAGMRVVVLEKSSFKGIAAMSGIERSAFRDMYECAGLFTTPDSAISILAGSTLGGGTRINWCASFRTPDHVRQEWASKHGLPNFTSERYGRALDAVCDRLGVHQDVTYNRQNSLLIQGLNRTGLHSGPIPQNCRLPHACSMHCGLGCAYGGKMDTVRTFLSDAAQHGAKILTQANARRIITRRARSSDTVSGTRRREVVGVVVECVGTDEVHDDGPRAPAAKLLVRAKIVVSSGGSLHTPALLLRSGIRGGGQVGAHLHLHPATVLAAKFPQEHTVAGTEVVQKIWQGPIMTAYSRASADWEGGGYGPMVALPAASPGLLGACISWEGGEELKEDLLDYPGLVFPLVYVRDRGEGRITIDSRGEPVAQYWPSTFDRQSMREGLVLAAKAMEAAGASRLFTLHNAPLRYEVDEQHSEERFAAWLKQLQAADFKPNTMTVASAHQMGSCRMGSCASNSAVDGEGHSWEVDGLYVADASAFPTASGVNPMITVQAISYMVAEGIAARYPTASKTKGRC